MGPSPPAVAPLAPEWSWSTSDRPITWSAYVHREFSSTIYNRPGMELTTELDSDVEMMSPAAPYGDDTDSSDDSSVHNHDCSDTIVCDICGVDMCEICYNNSGVIADEPTCMLCASSM